MKKIKLIMNVFIFLITCSILTSCDIKNDYNKVKEITNELINKKISELEIEYNHMYNKLIEYDIFPDNIDLNTNEIYKNNDREYYSYRPTKHNSLNYIEHQYFLPDQIEFSFLIVYENVRVRLTRSYYFKNNVSTYEFFFYNYEETMIGYDDLTFNMYEKELNFFSTYLNLEKNLVNELKHNLDYKYLIEDYDLNKMNDSLKYKKVSKSITKALNYSSKIEYNYGILQNNETLLYDNYFGISYYQSMEDITNG